MNAVVRRLSSFLPSISGWKSSTGAISCQPAPGEGAWQRESRRGVRVWVKDGNLEWALAIMQRKMQSSGMERLIKRRVDHHLKNSEKCVLARKNLELRVRSHELGRKLRTILVKKIRGL